MLYLFKIDITTPMIVSIGIFIILLLTQTLNSGHGNHYHNYILIYLVFVSFFTKETVLTVAFGTVRFLLTLYTYFNYNCY